VDRRIPARATGFLTYGFPNGFDNGTEASGEVLVQDPGGWLQVRDTQALGCFIQPGFSGAPVVSQLDLRLMGMATAADRDKSTRLAFLLPAQQICRAFPPLAKPYRELFAFGEEDSDLFFGRDGFVAELKVKLDGHPFAAVIGPSGSGKSSVVLGGLVPRLREAGWQIVICRPLRDPLLQLGLGLASVVSPGPADFDSRNKKAEEWATRLRQDPARIVDLARAIGGGGTFGNQSPMLVVIDQFEELFTNDADAADGGVVRKTETTIESGSPRQAQFLAVLEAIAAQDPVSSPIRALATMRADFMNHALAIRRLASLLKDTDVKLGPMTAAELSEAVRRPARTFGVEFEEGLAEELVATMQARPGGLPMLQFALDRLWRKQDERMLTWAAYRGPDGKGGLETALNEHAEEVISRFGEAAWAGVRRVMLRLVRLGEDVAPDARAVARLREIGEADWPLAQKLADERSRLLTLGRDPETGEETAEVVHEALIGAWGRLRGWLIEDRDFGVWRQRLNEHLGSWSASPDDDLLLRGRVLAEALSWRESRGDDLNAQERAFVKASQDHARQEAEEALRQAQERERLANELAAAAQEREAAAKDLAEARGRALHEAQLARARQEAAAREAKGRQLAAEAVGAPPEMAAALAVEGWRRFPTPTAFRAAVTALSELPRYRTKHRGRVRAIAFSPEGDQLASCSDAGTVKTIHTMDGSELVYAGQYAGYERWANTVMSPLGDFVTIYAHDWARNIGTLRLISTADCLEVARYNHDGWNGGVTFSANGDLLAISSGDRTQVIRTAGGSEVAVIEHVTPTVPVAFSPAGDLMIIPGGDGQARLVRTVDMWEIGRIEDRGPVSTVAFSPTGDLFATAGAQGTVRLIRTCDCREMARVEHGELVRELVFSFAGDLLATTSGQGTTWLIRTSDGGEVAHFKHDGAGRAIAFSPTGDLLATASNDGTARLVRVADGREMARIGHQSPVLEVAFSPAGDVLATRSEDYSVRLIHTSGGKDISRVEHDGSVAAIAFSPRGDLLATGSGDRTARVISLVDGSETARIEHGGGVSTVAFSPTGDFLGTGSDDGGVQLIATADGVETAHVVHRDWVVALSFSPNGDLLATGSDDGTARLVRTADGIEVARIKHQKPVVAVAFSPKSHLLATASFDGHARLVRTTDAKEVLNISHGAPVSAVAFSPDDDLFAIAGKDGIAQIVCLTDRRQILRIEHGGSVTAVAFSPRGDLLATTSIDGTVRLFRVTDGNEVARIDLGSFVLAVAFDPSGDLLATGTAYGSLELIRTSDAGTIGRIEHGSSISEVAFSADGTLLATGCYDGSARLIRITDTTEAARVDHDGLVGAVAFSPASDMLATGSNDGSARLISVADGNEIARIDHGRPVRAVAFGPKGNQFATACEDGRARLLLMPGQVFDKLCRERIGRNLSAKEWTRHLGPLEEWVPTSPTWSSEPGLFSAWRKRNRAAQRNR
jgi:WD40 repeat protein